MEQKTVNQSLLLITFSNSVNLLHILWPFVAGDDHVNESEERPNHKGI